MKFNIKISQTAFLIFIAVALNAQNDFIWTKDLALPYTDADGQALTGTEVIHLVSHKGQLYAGNSYWNESTAPRRGQVWVKSGYNSGWERDYQMPVRHSRVPSLYSFVFQYDKNGIKINPDTILFAAATYDKGSNQNGPAVVFMRNDYNGTWVLKNLGYTDHPFDYTQIRSMGFYHDPITQEDIVFAGANPAPTGVYAGRYDPTAPGKIEWDPQPEFMPSGYQRIMGFAECNDTFYMATQREIYKRIDGPNPAQRWVQVFNLATPQIIGTYGANLDPYWLNDEDIRGFRSIPTPDGEELIFGALNHIFRLSPSDNYLLIPEQDIEDVLESATGNDFHYIQTQIIKDFTNPYSGEIVQLIGFEALYDTAFLAANPQPNLGGFNLQGWYFERKQSGADISYQLKEIQDLNIQPQPDSLARVRTFELSPFPQDSGRVIYSGGFAPWFAPDVTNTAWIYRGALGNSPVSGSLVFKNIPYATGSPQEELSLDIYVPKGGASKKPVMIYVHGGSWRTGDKAHTGNKDDFFTANDYIFVSANYRLSPNPINLADSARIKFPVHPQDVAKAIGWVFNNIAEYGGDTAKISLIGHSAGAHLVALVSTDTTYLSQQGIKIGQLKCTCALDGGGYDIPYYLNKYEMPGSAQWNSYVNAFGSEQTAWEEASPITHITAGIGIPDFLLVHQGTNQRIDLANHFGWALEQFGVPTTYLNATPLDHEGINQVLGSPLAAAKPYNDFVSSFFSNCLSNSVSTHSIEKAQANLLVFPNPSTDMVTVALSAIPTPVQIQIYNAQGQFVYAFEQQSQNQMFSVMNYPSGLYFLKILTAGKTITTFFVKV